MNSLERFLAAANCKPCDRPPVWLMRQAGRYLPEYRELREKYSFLEICRRPDLAVEASLQPLRRFGMDAVIFFSDILLPLQAFGLKLTLNDEEGPSLDLKVRSLSDINRLAKPNVRTSLNFALEIIEMLKYELKDETALIGFVGAPWTLACYLTEGGSGDFGHAVGMAKEKKEVMAKLLDHVTDTIAEYAVQQIRFGANAIQIFDTWGGLLDPMTYSDLALPHIKRICDAVNSAGGVSILFIRDSEKLIDIMNKSGAKVLSFGSRTDITEVWKMIGANKATQGNVNPEILLGSPASVAAATEKFLNTIGNRAGHIVNLGHGILPKTRPDSVKAFVDTVKSWSQS